MTARTARRAALALAGLALVGTLGLRAVRTTSQPAAGSPPVHYRLLVAPGGDPASIHVDVDRAERLEIDAAGNLMIRTGGRIVQHPKPRAYQDVGGVRRDVGARFEFTANGELRLALDAYDRSQPLIIAPLF